MKMKSILFGLFALLWSTGAYAQTAPNWTNGYVPTPAEWNAVFAGKQDYLGSASLLLSGGIMNGELTTASSTLVTSGFNLPPGVAPTSPFNGDMWTTAAGVFVQINGSTIGPLAQGTAGSFTSTSPIVTSFPGGGIVNFACATCGVKGSPLSQFAATTSAQLAGVISDETGTGSLVFNTSPTFVTPVLGTVAAGSILTNATGLPVATGIAGLGTGVATWLGTPSSANLAAAVTNETGSGSLVFNTSPALTTPSFAAIVNTGTLTLPTATDTLVGRITTDTMTNKTFTAPVINAGTISGTFAGAATFSGSLTLSSALTYGGVALANSVTGTGSMTLATSPTLTTPHIASIVNTGTLTLPTITDTLIGRTTTDTLTNKTLTAPAIAGGALSGAFSGTPTFSGANFITNSNLAQAGAATLKGNPTNALANDTDFTIQGLTARGAPDAANDKLPIYDNAAGTIKYVTPAQVAASATAGVSSIAGNTGAFTLAGGVNNVTNQIVVEQMNPGGRVTFAASTPVMNASQTSQTHIYYAPYNGRYVPVYTSGVGMRMLTFTSSDTDTVGLTINLGSNWAANSMYDVYAYNNAGVAGLCTSVDWSAGATPGSNSVGNSFRGAGALSAEQQLFKGFFTNKNSMVCRTSNTTTVTCAVNECTYLATARTDGTAGQVSWTKGAQGVAGTLNLWNQFNQKMVCSTSSDPNTSWTYNSPTQQIRQQDASTVNQFNWITGQASGDIDAILSQAVRPGAVALATVVNGIALNSTITFDKEGFVQTPTTGSNMTISIPVSNTYSGLLGANFISANENTDGSNTQTMFGATFMSFRVCQMM